MIRVRISCFLLIALFVIARPVLAQSPSPAPQPVPAFKVESNLVAVSVVVHGDSGQPIPNLTAQAFRLKDDAKPQQITYFSQGSDLPLTIALLVDTSGSQRDFIPNEIRAADSFFPALLTRPGDRAVLMQFDSEILELQELTGSIGKLQDSLDKLSEKRGYLAGSTRMYDAISAASHLELGHQLGRRAMVLLTDGDDHGSDTKLNAAIAAAQRADIMIYSVYYTSGTGNRKVLSRLSAATGGRVFTVGPDMTLHEIFATIADDMRLAYEIGYRPPPSRPDKFHKIEIRTANKSQSVQAREGYFSK